VVIVHIKPLPQTEKNESGPLVDIDALPGIWDDYDEQNDGIPV